MIKKTFLAAAFALLLSSSAHADAFGDGKQAYATKDWRTAILNLRPLAESGDDRAMILLGNMYADGFGVEKDEKEAFRLYHRAAVLNNKEAVLATAVMYQNGLGVNRNIPTAISWYERGARLGHQASAFFYAVHLYQGSKGTTYDFKPDHPAAYKWFKIAGKSEDNPSIRRAANQMAASLADKLPAEQVSAADKEAADWKPVDAATLGPVPDAPAAPKK